MKNTPKPIFPEGSKEKEASEIISTILDHMFNRQIHMLERNGYLNKEKHDSEYGYDSGTPRKALLLKWDLINEAQTKFAERLAKKLVPNQPAQVNPCKPPENSRTT